MNSTDAEELALWTWFISVFWIIFCISMLSGI